MTGIVQRRPFKAQAANSGSGFRWVSVWLAVGVVIGLLLLANSVRDYFFVARILTIQQVRQQVAQHITALERDQMENPSSDADLPKELAADLATGSIKPLWIVLRSADGKEIGRTGSEPHQIFTRDQLNNSFRNREPLFNVISGSEGETVVEVFPVRIRGRRPPPEQGRDQDRRQPPLSIEVAMPLTLSDPAALWPIRRDLLINSIAAFALLMTVALTGLGLRSYIRGKQLQQQLDLAREVQANLFPANVNVQDGKQIAVEYQPAEDVGGDFYDVFHTPDGMGLVIGDVSGKGVPAALLVGVIHGAVRSGGWTESRASHEQGTAALNRLLCERAASSRYATMFWSYGDAGTGTLNYVNAGHCAPILLSMRDGTPKIKRLEAGGTVLGLMPEVTYVQGQAPVQPGDLIVLYSDGLVEAANPAGEEFGESRLTQLLIESTGETPEKIRDSLIRTVRDFQNDSAAQDDLTCVIVRFGAPVLAEEMPHEVAAVAS